MYGELERAAMQRLFKDLIVIEGSDGSGKKTQSEMLKKYLDDNTTAIATLLDFPDYDSDTGHLVGAMLSGKFGDDAAELNSYFTSPMYSLDRYQYFLKLIRDNPYERKSIGICNRYTDSNLIHQGCRLNGTELMEYWSWLYDFEYNKLGIPKPSIVLYLDLPFEISYQNVVDRAKENGIETDINEQESYMKMVYDHVHRIHTFAGWRMINCFDGYRNRMRTREEIHEEIKMKLYHAAGKVTLNNLFWP